MLSGKFRWRIILVTVVFFLAALYGFPNFYQDDLAVQFSSVRGSGVISDSELQGVISHLNTENIYPKRTELVDGDGLLRFSEPQEQLRAKDLIEGFLGPDYVVALNFASTTPNWLADLGAGPMKLGLDLRGGLHFLLEVDFDTAVNQRLTAYVSELKQSLRKNRVRFRRFTISTSGLVDIEFRNEEYLIKGEKIIRDSYGSFFTYRQSDGLEKPHLLLALSDTHRAEIEDYALSQNLTALRNRVNELGISEPLVQRQGRNRIVVELAGEQDTAKAKRVLGATANLEFRLESNNNTETRNSELFKFRDDPLRTARLEKAIITTGNAVSDSRSSFDENGLPQVNISLDATGGRRMSEVTSKAVGRRMAVLFIESTLRVTVDDKTGERKEVRGEKRSLISLATIQSVLGNQFRITGLDSAQESSELALLLRAGALAAPMYFVEERTIGPSLGAENIEKGVYSVIIGFILVMSFMVIGYRSFGAIANLALAINLLLLVAIMSILQAVLTLPGIAGIVLTVGMAVDANVLIFSRIREERLDNISDPKAILVGFDRAFVTIVDANLTTLLVAVILAAIGTGPVKGFAITLAIGICTSMFTATLVTRLIVEYFFGNRRLPRWAL